MYPLLVDQASMLLICSLCQQALSINQLERHASQYRIHKAHGCSGKAWAKRVRDHCSSMSSSLREPKAFIHSRGPILPISGLRIFYNGLECKSCGFILIDKRNARGHLHDNHPLKRQSVTGSNAYYPWHTNVPCQQLSRSGPYSRYFKVVAEATPDRAIHQASTHTPSPSTSATSDELQAALAKVEALQVAAKAKQMRVIQQLGATEANPWLDNTGWIPPLADLDRDQLLSLLVPPEEKLDPVLFAFEKRFNRIVTAAIYALRTLVDRSVRKAIRVVRRDEAPFQILSSTHQAATITGYRQIFLLTTRVIFRTWSASSDAAAIVRLIGNAVLSRDRTLSESLALPYRLTPNQLAAIKVLSTTPIAMWNAIEIDNCSEDGSYARLDQVDDSILDFALSLFTQRLSGGDCPYNASPVFYGLALQGLRMKHGGWLSSCEYTSKLAGITHIVRLLVILKSVRLFPNGVDETAILHGHPLATIAEPGGQVIDAHTFVKSFVGKWMTADDCHIMHYIHDLKNYGMAVSKETTKDGNISWINDEIHYNGVNLSLNQLKAMLASILNEAKQVLLDKLVFLKENELPAIQWDRLVDNEQNTEVGWNFLQDHRNARTFAAAPKNFLFQHIFQSKRAVFFSNGAPPNSYMSFHWKTDGVIEWSRALDEFLGLLLVLIHITSGQPARGSELLSTLHSNSSSGTRRGIFIEAGLLVCVPRYSKQYSRTTRATNIRRYLPRQVGELLLYYLWLVLPFRSALALDLHQIELSSELWNPKSDGIGREWSSQRLSELLGKHSESKIGTRITIQPYRHIAIAIARKYILHEHIQGFGDMGHELDVDDELDEHGNLNSADLVHLQAGHSASTADSIYARLATQVPGEVSRFRRSFRRISVLWAELLGFSSSLDLPQKRNRDLSDKHAREASEALLSGMDKLRVLQRLYGPEAEFRGSQEELLDLIIKAHPRILAVMPTGGGKSLGFLLPAKWEHAQCTIVVTPLNALRMDLTSKAHAFGISAVEWDPYNVPSGARLVFVTSEATLTLAFGNFLASLRANNALDRIVVDEAHMYLGSKETFRKDIGDMRHLCILDTQVVFLTATLSPSSEMALFKIFGIEDCPPKILRKSTRRSNIAYKVFSRPSTKVSPADCEFEKQYACALHRQQELKLSGNVLLLAPTRAVVETLAKKYQCDSYHAGKTDFERRKAMKDFCAGTSRLLAATSSFGTGVDIPNIRLVFHFTAPITLMDYGQESGRAGRDGSKAEACVTFDPEFTSGVNKLEFVDEPMQKFLKSTRCRRFYLDWYFDGATEEIPCNPQSEALCDVCDPSCHQNNVHGLTHFKMPERVSNPIATDDKSIEVSIQRNLRNNVQKSVRDSVNEQQAFKQYCELAEKICFPCLIKGQPEHNHGTASCPTDVKGFLSQVRKRMVDRDLKLEAYSACFKCHHPQWMCDSYRTKSLCNFDKASLWFTVLNVISNEELQERMELYNKTARQKCFNVDTWLVKREIQNALNKSAVMSNLHRMFLEACDRIQQTHRMI